MLRFLCSSIEWDENGSQSVSREVEAEDWDAAVVVCEANGWELDGLIVAERAVTEAEADQLINEMKNKGEMTEAEMRHWIGGGTFLAPPPKTTDPAIDDDDEGGWTPDDDDDDDDAADWWKNKAAQ